MDVLNLNDFTTKKINEILDRAQAFRDGKKVDYQGRKVVANLFLNHLQEHIIVLIWQH